MKYELPISVIGVIYRYQLRHYEARRKKSGTFPRRDVDERGAAEIGGGSIFFIHPIRVVRAFAEKVRGSEALPHGAPLGASARVRKWGRSINGSAV